MATIQKRGNSYRIRVSMGYDTNGKQICKTMTWKPDEGMTEGQIKKAVNRQATLFEEQVKLGQCMNGSIKFQEFCEIWFQDYANDQLKESTLHRYRGLRERVYQGIGHLRIDRIQPHHLTAFYKNLAEPTVREENSFVSRVDLKKTVLGQDITLRAFRESVGISETTFREACKGHSVSAKTAEKIANAFGVDREELFQGQTTTAPLSSLTIRHYHAYPQYWKEP